MTRERQLQWSHRLEQLQALRDRFAATHRYSRAYKAYRTVQHLYDRWADEVFATARPR
ncbi:MAG TPA: hypothetical protein VHG30_18360 [Microvirga sp.]|nr:hypothetical protein [Microvirga sp.]